jgi:periplasmic divalent cation tolerance protein
VDGDKHEIILVLTNLPDRESAGRIARLLVEARLAACVNVFAPCSSTYRWRGSIEVADEIPLLIKTTVSAYARVESLILAQHPYELPEIIRVPLETGLAGYLQWVNSEVDGE